MELPKQLIANIGLFHVCYELSRRGLNVVPTSRNTRAVDVIVGSADFNQHKTVQVKTSTIDIGVYIGKKTKFPTKEAALRETSLADFWVYVRLDMNAGFAVLRVTVWEGSDEDLLMEGKNDWWYRPWDYSKKTTPAMIQKKWSDQTDEGGWRLITGPLSAQPSR